MSKILVVDDDPEFVQMLRMQLESLGHQSISAPDATVGLMLALREKPDLVALDYQLPGGDGMQLRDRLRNNSFTAAAKVLFISSMNREAFDCYVPNEPSLRFLQKPFDQNALKGVLAEMLEGKAPALPSDSEAAARAPSPEPKPRLDGGALGGDILDLDLP